MVHRMKKLFLSLLFFFCTLSCFAETSEIVIDNTRHKFEDYFLVTNHTSDAIYLNVFVRRKDNTPEKKVGFGLVPPKARRFKIETNVDDEFNDYNYII